MAQQNLNLGTTPNDGTGDPLRTGLQKVQDMMTEIYGILGGLGTASTKSTGVAAGNVPVLDGSGLLATSVLPALAISDVSVVASQVAMLALTAQRGDVAIRTDLNKSFVLATDSPSTLSDWKELLTPTDTVLSVAGLTGAISASALLIALGAVNKAGDTMTGLLTLSGDPTSSNHAATKAYVDASSGGGGGGSSSPSEPQGRLTLQSGAPVMTTSQIAKTTLFYAPYKGRQAPINTAAGLKMTDFLGELVTSTTDTAKSPAAIGASKVNDWFLWEDSSAATVTIASPGVFTWTAHGFALNHPVLLTTTGVLSTGLAIDTVYFVKTIPTADTFTLSATPGGSVINTTGSQSGIHTVYTVRCTHGPDWTSDTARSAGTALEVVNGVLLNSVSITNGPAASRGTYVGTTRSNASSQIDWTFGGSAAGGLAAVFGVWNMYNRVNVSSGIVTDSTSSWTYTGAFRASNGSAGMRASAVLGLNEDAITAAFSSYMTNGAASAGLVGIGLDSTTASSGNGTGGLSVGTSGPLTSSYGGFFGLGYHFLQALEATAGTGSVTFYGSNGAPSAYGNSLVVNFRM